MKCHVWWFFKILLRKNKFSLKSDNNNGYFTWRLCKFMIISRWVILRMRSVSDKSCRENQNTHFMFNNFFPKNRTGYEIMWKNMVDAHRPQTIIYTNTRSSLCLSVCPSLWKDSASTGQIFMKFDFWVFFQNMSGKFKFGQNRAGITGILQGDLCTFMTISLWVLRIRNVSDKSCRENQNTFYVQWLFSENRKLLLRQTGYHRGSKNGLTSRYWHRLQTTQLHCKHLLPY
jgi:hypothetical protein